MRSKSAFPLSIADEVEETLTPAEGVRILVPPKKFVRVDQRDSRPVIVFPVPWETPVSSRSNDGLWTDLLDAGWNLLEPRESRGLLKSVLDLHTSVSRCRDEECVNSRVLSFASRWGPLWLAQEATDALFPLQSSGIWRISPHDDGLSWAGHEPIDAYLRTAWEMCVMLVYGRVLSDGKLPSPRVFARVPAAVKRMLDLDAALSFERDAFEDLWKKTNEDLCSSASQGAQPERIDLDLDAALSCRQLSLEDLWNGANQVSPPSQSAQPERIDFDRRLSAQRREFAARLEEFVNIGNQPNYAVTWGKKLSMKVVLPFGFLPAAWLAVFMSLTRGGIFLCSGCGVLFFRSDRRGVGKGQECFCPSCGHGNNHRASKNHSYARRKASG